MRAKLIFFFPFFSQNIPSKEKMATPPFPTANPLDEVDKLGLNEQIGYLTVNESQVLAYVNHLEEVYVDPDPTPEPSPPNKWADYSKAVVQAMQRGFTTNMSDQNFLSINIGYLFNQVTIEHMADMRSRQSIVHKDFSEEEIFGIQEYYSDQECAKCKVGHVMEGNSTECPASYGPYDVELLKDSTMLFDSYAAMIVGTKSLIQLHEVATQIFLNVGIINLENISLKSSKTGLANEVRRRIQLLNVNSVMPILVEFYHDEQSSESVPSQLHMAISTLAKLQRDYNGPIVLIIPPYQVKVGDGIAEYNKGKQTHKLWETMGSLLGKFMGLAVGSLIIQSEYWDTCLVANHPMWVVEPLFNENSQCAREYYRRIHETMMCITNALHQWIVPISKRQQSSKFSQNMNAKLLQCWQNLHRRDELYLT